MNIANLKQLDWKVVSLTTMKRNGDPPHNGFPLWGVNIQEGVTLFYDKGVYTLQFDTPTRAKEWSND